MMEDLSGWRDDRAIGVTGQQIGRPRDMRLRHSTEATTATFCGFSGALPHDIALDSKR